MIFLSYFNYRDPTVNLGTIQEIAVIKDLEKTRLLLNLKIKAFLESQDHQFLFARTNCLHVTPWSTQCFCYVHSKIAHFIFLLKERNSRDVSDGK